MIPNKVNGNSAVFTQTLLLIFFLPVLLLVLYIVITKNPSVEGFGFLSVLIMVNIIVMKIALSFADIYISDDKIIIKKVTGEQTKSKLEVRSIDEAILPFTYYVEFDKGKFYFQLKPKDILKRVAGQNSEETLAQIKEKFKL